MKRIVDCVACSLSVRLPRFLQVCGSSRLLGGSVTPLEVNAETDCCHPPSPPPTPQSALRYLNRFSFLGRICLFSVIMHDSPSVRLHTNTHDCKPVETKCTWGRLGRSAARQKVFPYLLSDSGSRQLLKNSCNHHLCLPACLSVFCWIPRAACQPTLQPLRGLRGER